MQDAKGCGSVSVFKNQLWICGGWKGFIVLRLFSVALWSESVFISDTDCWAYCSAYAVLVLPDTEGRCIAWHRKLKWYPSQTPPITNTLLVRFQQTCLWCGGVFRVLNGGWMNMGSNPCNACWFFSAWSTSPDEEKIGGRGKNVYYLACIEFLDKSRGLFF